MPLKIASSKNRYPLPWLDYEEEAVSDHERVEALRLGRKPAGNRLIYFSIYLPQMGGLRSKFFSVNGLEYSMTAYVRK